MTEMSVVSSRKTKLQQLADEGSSKAATALELALNHGKFLSTVQVGITVIGIMNGAFGEATVGKLIERWFESISFLAEYAHGLSTFVFILGITFLSILFGELIPKKIALRYPEKIAMMTATPMCWVAWVAHPFVKVLNYSSNIVMRAFGPEPINEPVTEEEIKVLMEQGAEAGVFEESEQQLVSRVFSMDDRKVKSVMTPRGEIAFLSVNDSLIEQKAYVCSSRYSRFPVCDDTGLDNVLGVVHAKKLLDNVDELDVKTALERPLYVPASLNLTQLLSSFRTHRQHLAFVIDEYGHIEGLVTMFDVMEALMGDMVSADMDTDPDVVRREDGSLLVAGQTGFDRLGQFEEWVVPEGVDDDIHTIGGYIMYKLGKVPRVGDVTEDEFYRFEVIDMDKNRVDRVLVSKKQKAV